MKKLKKRDFLEITAKEWFDKVNGNSYFCAWIFINGKEVAKIPFRYGYGFAYLQAARHELVNVLKVLPPAALKMTLVQYCIKNGIHFTAHIQTGCRKNQLIIIP